MKEETTNQALARNGFRHVSHEPGGDVCRSLLGGRTLISCDSHKHIERTSDGKIVTLLEHSPDVLSANAWIAGGCET